MRKTILTMVACATTLWVSTALADELDEQKCQSSKNNAAGRYAACRQSAESKLAATGDTDKYNASIIKCEDKFDDAWQKAIDKASAASTPCLDVPLVAADFRTVIDEHADNIATALGGGGFPPEQTCGNNLAEGTEVCDGTDLNSETCATETPSTPYGTLACNAGCTALVSTGCVGRFERQVVGSDATVIDHETGREWVATSATPGSLTDYAAQFSWSAADPHEDPDGTVFTVYLANLNAGSGYGGHKDWRLPTSSVCCASRKMTAAELESILDFTQGNCLSDSSPCIDQSIFGPTQPANYWSGTTYVESPAAAGIVNFDNGFLNGDFKGYDEFYARAVRDHF